MDYTKWHVGMRVVCTKGINKPMVYGRTVAGHVYTIRELCLTRIGTPGIRLCEVRFASVTGTWDFGGQMIECSGDEPVGARHFRPVDESRLDIFRSILTDAPKHAETVE